MTLKDERLYVADLRQIQVLDPTSGEVIQAFPSSVEDNSFGILYVAPVVDGAYLIAASQLPASGFFGSARNIVLKLDVKTGAEQWRFDGAAGQYIESGTVSGETFVIGNSDGNVYALSVESGELLWAFETGHRVWATPLIVDDIVYIGSMDHSLYALRLSDGSEIWRFTAGGAFASTPALQDGTLYIGSFDNRIYAIDVADGTERWHFPLGQNGQVWFWGSPAVGDDKVYAVDVKGEIYALSVESGEEIWHHTLEAPVRAGPALSEDGSTLLVSGQTGTLYALNTTDGTQKWAAEGKGAGYMTPIVDGDKVYETRIQGTYRVRALELLEGGDGYKELWVYPPEIEE
jgi:outer membrane protein assembly factor BamB